MENKEFYYERQGERMVLRDSMGKEYNPLKKLPSLKDAEMKQLIDDAGLPHLIFGNTWHIYDRESIELETIEAPIYENGKPTGELYSHDFLTMEAVEKSREFWKEFVRKLTFSKKD